MTDKELLKLRERAEQELSSRIPGIENLQDTELHRLIHELEVQKIELELQNEKLKREYSEIYEDRKKAEIYLNIAGTIMVVIDADQTVSMINKKGCDILGYTREEIIGKNWFDNFIPERLRDEIKNVFDRVMSGEMEGVEHYENPVLTKSDRERMISWHNTTIRDETGKISGSLSSGEDITELKKNEQFLRQIFDSLGEGIAVIDRNFRINNASSSYVKQTGSNYESIIGQYCYSVSHKLERPCYEKGEDCPIKRTFETGQPHSAIHTHRDDEGNPVYVEVKSYPMKDDAGKCVSVIESVTDITDNHQLEIELKKRIRDLEDFYEIAVGREIKMKEMKEEIERLKRRIV